jgi:hypothetical protein
MIMLEGAASKNSPFATRGDSDDTTEAYLIRMTCFEGVICAKKVAPANFQRQN